MSFQLMNDDVQIISKLGDEPNEDDGLDAAGLKAKFDQAATLLKAAHNALVNALSNKTAAINIGFNPSTNDLVAENVQAAIEEVQSNIDIAAQASIADNAVSTDKIADGNVTKAKLSSALVDEIEGKADAGTTLADYGITDAVKQTDFNNLQAQADSNTNNVNTWVSARTPTTITFSGWTHPVYRIPAAGTFWKTKVVGRTSVVSASFTRAAIYYNGGWVPMNNVPTAAINGFGELVLVFDTLGVPEYNNPDASIHPESYTNIPMGIYLVDLIGTVTLS